MDINWTEGFSITVGSHDDEVTISANREGLLSLSDQLKALADGMPGDHIHYDEHSCLEVGSKELVIEKVG